MKTSRPVLWSIVCIVAVAGAVFLQCVNPTEKDVRWRTSVDLPVTSNKQVFLGSLMDTTFFDKKQIKVEHTYDTVHGTGAADSIDTISDTTMMLLNGYAKYDSVEKKTIPDTVTFGFPNHDTASSTISEDSLKDTTYQDVFGPIPISGAPVTEVGIPLAGSYTGGAPHTSPTVPVTLKWIYRLELSGAAQSIVLHLKNNGNVRFTSMQITLGTPLGILGSSILANLAAGATDSMSFNVANKIIDSVITVKAIAVPQASGTFAAGNTVGVRFTLNKLVANRVVADDTLFAAYRRTFTNKYELTDTIDVDYIDIENGFFLYSITNSTKVKLLLTVIHRHLWQTDFCEGKTPSIAKWEDIVGMTKDDSMSYHNGAVAQNGAFSPGETNTYEQHNISKTRLFPEWEPGLKKSVTQIDYHVKVNVSHKRITLSAGDSLRFVIKATNFKFKTLYGKSMEEYCRKGDSSVIPVKLPWTKSVTDSLRDNFVLQKVLAKVKSRMEVPDGARIDTMKIHYVMRSVTHPAVACSSDAVLLNVMKDSTYERPIDITSVVNDYPDSVKVTITLKIPVHTHVKAVNDLTDPKDSLYKKYIGRMIIKGFVDYNMVAPLCWTIVDTASMDLGGDTLDLGKAAFVTDPLKKMTDRHANFTVDVTNFTNVYMKLYALAATDSGKVGPLVDTSNKDYLTTNQLTQLINNPTKGYINLLGNGLLIPPRDSAGKTRNSVALSDDDLTRILGAEVTGWRWQARFLPRYNGSTLVKTPDALNNTDWIKLNSWIHVDGVNSVDSLFSGN